MLDKNVIVDDKSQGFETPIKHNYSVTAPRDQVLLGSDTLQFQHNTTTHITLQKLPPSVRDIFPQTDRKTSQSAQFYK